jgi:hypothetical protein
MFPNKAGIFLLTGVFHKKPGEFAVRLLYRAVVVERRNWEMWEYVFVDRTFNYCVR